eukprot:Skav219793  [mRNA]  locus=scaffold147:68548:69083:- [translate_table: standard]
MFHELEILRILPKEDAAEFRLVSRQEDRRTVEEQLLSALDGAEAFGARLCDLVSQQLAAERGDEA